MFSQVIKLLSILKGAELNRFLFWARLAEGLRFMYFILVNYAQTKDTTANKFHLVVISVINLKDTFHLFEVWENEKIY